MDVYPAGPTQVPPSFTSPSSAYRRHAWLAFLALLAFLAAYFALAGYFAWTSYRLFRAAGTVHDEWFWLMVGGVAIGFLSLFMIKAVFFVKRGGVRDTIEVTAAEQPRLFAFLHKLADEARAPRPYRVFVSHHVNAGVFYDLTLLNLIIPSRKNLEIGLGLANVLTLGEVKAVLAHELGHFAQRTMAIGRWVYIGQQIAGHLVARRDAFDRFLAGLSAMDFRIAWVGWLLRLIVWAIRALVDTLFGWVVIAERVLSREMEFQADRVAVALTGSDSLVNALYRLEAVDHAMDLALGFVASEHRAGRAVEDVFALQTHMLERARIILGEPHYGTVPPSDDPPQARRLFRAQLAAPPRMWSTHPPSNEREDQAKRTYIAAPLDDRSAWLLFEDAEALRRRVTAALYGDEAPEPSTMEATLARLDEDLARPSLDPCYRGAYLGRSLTRHTRRADELWHAPAPTANVVEALDALYPSELATELDRNRDLAREVAMLEGLQQGFLKAPDKHVRYRGMVYRRGELPALIATAKADLEASRRALIEHDRRCRTACIAAAERLGGGWAAYLRALVAMLHYAEHTEADLDDAVGALANVIAVITADGRVSQSEAERALSTAHELYTVLGDVHSSASELELGGILAARLEVESWADCLGELELASPTEETLGQWLGVIDSWTGSAMRELHRLRNAVLDELLATEALVAAAARDGTTLPEVTESPRVPARYATLPEGSERVLQTRLGWWDRFQTADGLILGALRLVVAGAIVGAVVLGARAATEAAALAAAMPTRYR
ncbi:MAG TPA: M48 family metallopeptidase [Kofleriaceae bacterium]|jgi:Zn-dependent protease with chaperone function|nr:M48 family metallopeptidase [Kofleriaceae bacterium]